MSGRRRNNICDPHSEGDDSEIEIDFMRDKVGVDPRTSAHQIRQIVSFQEILDDKLDKIGPRIRHCMDQFINEQDLEILRDDEINRDLGPRAKKYIML